MTREEAYGLLRPFLWCAIWKRSGKATFRTRTGPFTWSPARPEPAIIPGRVTLAIYPNEKPRDFPNPDMEWGHPDFDVYLRGYRRLDELLARSRRVPVRLEEQE